VIGLAVAGTVQAPGSVADPGLPGLAPKRPWTSGQVHGTSCCAGLRRAAGVVPFGVYVTLFLLAPMVAVTIGAFQANDGGFTLSNVNAATHGIYLKASGRASILSVLTSSYRGSWA